MDRIEFLVQGSAIDPYKVIFRINANNLTATCTCPAGEVGQCCKHRIRILDGDLTGIKSNNADAVTVVTNWAKGSDVERALRDLRKAEQELEEAKKRVAIYKKKLAQSLSD